MIRYLSGLLILLSSLNVMAQKNTFTPPDFRKINKIISKGGSEGTYQKLMERYRVHDTSLSPEAYHVLYFGYSLQPEYAPYAHQPFADSLLLILKKAAISADKYNLVIKYATSILEKSPFDMRYLDPLIYVYRMQGKDDLASKLEFKLGRIIETIFNTGDGLTEKTAFHVIAISHEYDILRALGFGFAGEQSLTKGQCDFLKVETNDYGIPGMYFNVTALFKSTK